MGFECRKRCGHDRLETINSTSLCLSQHLEILLAETRREEREIIIQQIPSIAAQLSILVVNYSPRQCLAEHRIKGWILAAPGEQSGAPCRTNTLVRVAQPCGREELVFVPSPSPEHPPEPSGHRCVSGTAGKTHLALHSPAKPWAGDGSRQFVPMSGLCTGTHKPGISQGCPTPLSFLQLPQALLLQSSLSWGIFLEFY